MRVVCYLTSPNFLHITLNSIRMLRQYNKTINIRVFVIGDPFPLEGDFEVVFRPSIDSYFCNNRFYLSECQEESVLLCDSDTFIFGNIEILFDKHRDVDFTAATDVWIINTPTWNQQALLDSYKQLNGNIVPVFQGGVQLWNNFTIKEWAKSVPTMCQKLVNKEFPITPWLYHYDCYHRETFSICFHVSQQKLSYDIFSKQEVTNLFSWEDYHNFSNKDCVVYHCFTQNWRKLYNRLRKPPCRLICV